MSLSSYADLQGAIASWLNTPDLAALIPDFIRLCEADLQRRVVHLYGMSSTANLVLNAGMAYLPDDFNGVVAVQCGKRLNFTPVDDFYALGVREGQPASYTLTGAQIAVQPAPVDGTVVTMTYKVRLDLLSGGPNWLFEAHPDVYLFGALAHAASFVEQDVRAAQWGQRYHEILDAIERDGIRLSGGSALQLKSSGV